MVPLEEEGDKSTYEEEGDVFVSSGSIGVTIHEEKAGSGLTRAFWEHAGRQGSVLLTTQELYPFRKISEAISGGKLPFSFEYFFQLDEQEGVVRLLPDYGLFPNAADLVNALSLGHSHWNPSTNSIESDSAGPDGHLKIFGQADRYIRTWKAAKGTEENPGHLVMVNTISPYRFAKCFVDRQPFGLPLYLVGLAVGNTGLARPLLTGGEGPIGGFVLVGGDRYPIIPNTLRGIMDNGETTDIISSEEFRGFLRAHGVSPLKV